MNNVGLEVVFWTILSIYLLAKLGVFKKTTRKKQMALSDTVKTSLRDAQENLRNALAFSARQEKPFVSKHIADMMANIENIIDASEVIDKMENRKDGDSGFFGTFFNKDDI